MNMDGCSIMSVTSSAAMPALSLISPSSPKQLAMASQKLRHQLGMVSQELCQTTSLVGVEVRERLNVEKAAFSSKEDKTTRQINCGRSVGSQVDA